MLTTLLNFYITGVLLGAPTPENPLLHFETQSLLEASAIPEQNNKNIGPVIKARSAIAVDLKTGFPLYEKNIYERLPIASLTKLMTAIIVLEENKLTDVVTVSRQASVTQGSKIWLAAGEKMTIQNLLYAALIPSANDAAYALAEFNSGDVDKFVAKMNKKALELGLYDTHFTNPIGLDEGRNYSSAYDLTLLGRYAFHKDFIKKAGVLRETEISSTDGKLKHKMKTTNDLLKSYLKVLGLKTGTTDKAGQCLIAVIENSKGQEILTVVLDSPDRYQETKILADWIFRTFNWY